MWCKHKCDNRQECTLSRLAGGTKLGWCMDGSGAIQKDVYKLENWAEVNLMTFNKGKLKVLHLGRNNCRHQHMLGVDCHESSFAEKAAVVPMDSKVNVSQQCANTAVCPCGKEAQQHPGLREEECCWQVGGSRVPLFTWGTSWVLSWAPQSKTDSLM